MKERISGEMRAVDVESSQFIGDRHGDLAKDLFRTLTEKDEFLTVSLGELRVLTRGSAGVTKAVPT